MRILDRYIRTTLLHSTLLVALMLAALFSFLEILDQLDDLDQGNYGIGDAAKYVMLTLPRRLTDLMPIIAMLGTAFGLNTLARSSELIAMRAAGVSTGRITWSILKTGFLLMLLVVVMEQFIAPPLQQHALRERLAAISGDTGVTLQGDGFWSSRDNIFAHVRGMAHGKLPANLDIYEFDPPGKLTRYLHASTAETTESGNWLLHEVRVKKLDGPELEYGYLETLEYPRIMRDRDLAILEVPARSLSLSDLNSYVNYLHEHQRPSEEYEINLWRKLARPLVTVAMVLVAIPFAFGSNRSSPGRRITFASLGGLLLYLGNEISANASTLFGISPQVATLAPVAVILLTALILMRRSE